MTEGEEKFGLMRNMVRELKESGVPKEWRRELVMASVASGNSWNEKQPVIDNLINKYVEVEINNLVFRVIFVAPHWVEPNQWDAASALEDYFPGKPRNEIASEYAKWRDAHVAGEFTDANNLTEDQKIFAEFRKKNQFEPHTDELVDGVKGNIIKFKKPRTRGDANDPTWGNEDPSVTLFSKTDREKRIAPREYGTNARFALYWAIRAAAEKMNIVDENGRLSEPLMVVLVHGMVNSRVPQDLVVGGGRLMKGKDVDLMSRTMRAWIPVKLTLLAHKMGISIKDNKDSEKNRPVQVGVHVANRLNMAIYKPVDDGVEIDYIDSQNPDGSGKKVKRFAAANTGLDKLRSGWKQRVFGIKRSALGLKEKAKTFTVKGLGPNLHVVQLEISEKMRSQPELKKGLMSVFKELEIGFQNKEWLQVIDPELLEVWRKKYPKTDLGKSDE
jgi:hypothetical protein